MLVRSAAAARQQNLAVQRLLSSTSLLTSSACSSSTPTPSAPVFRRHVTTNHTVRPWRTKTLRGLGGFERRLATAVEERNQHLDIPFESFPTTPLYELKPLSSHLVIPTAAIEPDVRPKVQNGIPGDVQEMLCVFDACLRVGRLDRASQVLKRVTSAARIRRTELMELHDRWLEAKLVQMHSSEGSDKGDDLHQWFELQIRSNDLPHTDDTIALLLKASLLGPGHKLSLRVKRYMSLLDQETALESLYLGGLLSTEDLSTIAEICPEYNAPLNTIAWEEQMADQDLDERVMGTPSTTSHTVPEVLSTPQKGMGLKMLKQTLSIFSEIPDGRSIASLPHAQRREIQARLEKDCVDAAIARWREENQALLNMGLNTSLASGSLSSRLYDWQRDLEARIVQELELVEASEAAEGKTVHDTDRCTYGPFLRLSSPSRLAATTILSTLSSMAMGGVDKGVPLSSVVSHIAKTVEEDIRLQLRDQGRQTNKLALRRQRQSRNPRRSLQDDKLPDGKRSELASAPLETKLDELDKTRSFEVHEPAWAPAIKAKVGCALFQCLLETAKVAVVREHPETKELVSQRQPAFTHTMQLKKGRKVGTVVANRRLVDLMRQEPNGDFLARHLPMVAEPEPWKKFDKGGFIVSPAQLLRVKAGEKDQQIYADAALARGDLDQVLKGLDVLGKTSWIINKPVFEVMLEAWNSGEEIASFPALNPTFTIPPEPDSSQDPSLRSTWVKAVKAAENAKSGMHSERCFMNFQLEIARAFRDQTFYFPHNIDFRGRAYPIPAYLNHMGADHVRGLLAFAEGKPLGESGLRWLKVHLANVYGFDKASLTEREDFVLENIEHIRDSAANPLTGNRWWLKAEDPWQCLAACMEIKAALDLPDPTQYVSHLPVHQDGTCNGLQHYAALGGDVWGAQQVNLVPGDRPADVYSAVAKSVEEYIAEDADNGVRIAQALRGKITRKVVKQTVMTNVYGVTFVGAKKQVQKQIDAIYPDIYSSHGIESYVCSHYITTKIFLSLSNMFRGAHDIQNWLGEIGGRVCRAVTPEQMKELFDTPIQSFLQTKIKKSATAHAADEAEAIAKAEKAPRLTEMREIQGLFRSAIVWTTPLRMPVVQPYRKTGTRVIKTCLQDLLLTIPEPWDPVNRRKQLQAFPPNFIHSLDASHMLLSALECDSQGLTFAAVHDSFWTHACDVGAMSDVLRDAFIRIHSEDVVGRLAAEFKARYKDSLYLAAVKAGSEVGHKIKSWRKKARTGGLKKELEFERERQMLLSSSDPEEVQRGKEMVTPGSLFEAHAAADDLASSDESVGLDPAVEGDMEADEAGDEHGIEQSDAEEMSGDAMAREQENETSSRKAAPGAPQAFTFGDGMMGRRPQTAYKKGDSIMYFWLPLTFPDIPKKGEFDVRMLKKSKYFFS